MPRPTAVPRDPARTDVVDRAALPGPGGRVGAGRVGPGRVAAGCVAPGRAGPVPGRIGFTPSFAPGFAPGFAVLAAGFA